MAASATAITCFNTSCPPLLQQRCNKQLPNTVANNCTVLPQQGAGHPHSSCLLAQQSWPSCRRCRSSHRQAALQCVALCQAAAGEVQLQPDNIEHTQDATKVHLGSISSSTTSTAPPPAVAAALKQRTAQADQDDSQQPDCAQTKVIENSQLQQNSCQPPTSESTHGSPSADEAVANAYEGFYGNRFFKLVPCEGGENTIEIDGVKMHISASKLPSQDAKDKVKLARVRKNSIVLDVCTGLGYSSIAAVRAGAKQVITLEKEESVLQIARQNPMSQDLFNNPAIQIMLGNAFDTIQQFPDEHFHAAMHDPPRLSHAGELYSQEFYCQLHRVLRSGGRLFHYTGSPGSKSGKNIPKGIKDRLAKAGFIEVRWVDSCQGFVASKL